MIDQKTKEIEAKIKAPGYCGSCYGAETTPNQCCNSCDAVREAYRKKGWAFTASDDIEQCFHETQERKLKYAKAEGCNMHGYFLVNKVAGNFHFAPGKSLHVRCKKKNINDFKRMEEVHMFMITFNLK